MLYFKQSTRCQTYILTVLLCWFLMQGNDSIILISSILILSSNTRKFDLGWEGQIAESSEQRCQCHLFHFSYSKAWRACGLFGETCGGKRGEAHTGSYVLMIWVTKMTRNWAMILLRRHSLCRAKWGRKARKKQGGTKNNQDFVCVFFWERNYSIDIDRLQWQQHFQKREETNFIPKQQQFETKLQSHSRTWGVSLRNYIVATEVKSLAEALEKSQVQTKFRKSCV